MSATTRAIFLALLAQAAVVAAVFALHGAGPDGAVVAARATARASAVVFSVALGLRTYPAGAGAMRGFIVAHAVHFAAVTYLAAVAVEHHLHHLNTRSTVVIIFGILLLGVIAVTTSDEARASRLNTAAVSLAFATFVGGAVLNGTGMLGDAHWPALLPLPALAVGLSWHLRNIAKAKSSAAAAAAT